MVTLYKASVSCLAVVLETRVWTLEPQVNRHWRLFKITSALLIRKQKSFSRENVTAVKFSKARGKVRSPSLEVSFH